MLIKVLYNFEFVIYDLISPQLEYDMTQRPICLTILYSKWKRQVNLANRAITDINNFTLCLLILW